MPSLFSLSATHKLTGVLYDVLHSWIEQDLLQPIPRRRGGIKLDAIGVATAAICAAFRGRTAGRLPVASLRPVAEFLRETGEEKLRAEVAAGNTALVFGGESLPPQLLPLTAKIANRTGEIALVMAVNLGGIFEAIDKAGAAIHEEAVTQN